MKSCNQIFKIENLTGGYAGKPVIKYINLGLSKGEICCVIGEEGAGKTTLIKAIVKQIDSLGLVYFKNQDLSNFTTSEMIRNNIDFIIQGGNILNGFTVEEHINLAMMDKIESEKSLIWKEIEVTFPKIILLKKQFAGRLSGGERMILSMACLLSTDAEMWLLDEPTAGIAPETCRLFGNFLIRMQQERGKTILMTEHNYDFAFEISDTVVILRDGKLHEKYLSNVFLQPDFIETKLYGTLSK